MDVMRIGKKTGGMKEKWEESVKGKRRGKIQVIRSKNGKEKVERTEMRKCTRGRTEKNRKRDMWKEREPEKRQACRNKWWEVKVKGRRGKHDVRGMNEKSERDSWIEGKRKRSVRSVRKVKR